MKMINLSVIVNQPGMFNINRFKYIFFRNKNNKQMMNPVPLKNINSSSNSHIETKIYYSNSLH